jgi:hypothetical protein
MARDGGGVTVRLKKPELVSSPALGEFLRDFLTFMTIHTPQIMKAMNVPPLTCSAHSGLDAGIVRRAGSMLPEFPASPLTLTLLLRGEREFRESLARLTEP